MGGETNMRLPNRAFITPMRAALADIFAVSNSVQDVASAVGELYDVANGATRAGIAGGPRAGASGGDWQTRSGYYRVHVLHGHKCKSQGSFFCKHLLAARRKHLEVGRSRCWARR